MFYNEMREILFRGKRVDTGQWLYGWLLYDFETNYISQNFDDVPPRTYQILNNNGYRFEVIPQSIGQFTNLLDKEGNKIFEGDIIEYTQHQFNTSTVKIKRKEVKWKYDKWSIFETNAGESDIKVVGNIIDNPELV